MISVKRLLHWERSGGAWCAFGVSEVALCRCDGGEVVDRPAVDEEEAAAYPRDRPTRAR